MELADFDGFRLSETITGFHNTKMRLDTLFSDVEKHAVDRVKEVQPEFEYIKRSQHMMPGNLQNSS